MAFNAQKGWHQEQRAWICLGMLMRVDERHVVGMDCEKSCGNRLEVKGTGCVLLDGSATLQGCRAW